MKRKTRKSEPSLTDFAAWRKRLRQAYEKAAKLETAANETVRPREQANNVFKLHAYAYYQALLKKDLLWELQAYVEERDGSQWQGRGDGPEQWVLRLAAARGKQKASLDEAEAAKARKKRSRIAAELKLAALNNVRPEALLGFLYEAGPINAIERDARDSVTYPWAEAYQ